MDRHWDGFLTLLALYYYVGFNIARRGERRLALATQDHRWTGVTNSALVKIEIRFYFPPSDNTIRGRCPLIFCQHILHNGWRNTIE